MRIVVTGGAGYLGSVLTRLLLSHGHTVVVYDCMLHGEQGIADLRQHDRCVMVRADLRDREAVFSALQNADSVVHLAAIVGDPACAEQPELAASTNIEGSKNVFDIATELGIRRVVFASTCSNYGKTESTGSLSDENSPLNPLSLYASTKVEMEKALLAMPNGVVLRFATLYGISPRMRFDLTVNEFVMELSTSNALTVFGLDQWRPYLHVSDAAAAIHRVLLAPDGILTDRVYNVGSTRENYTKRHIVSHLQNLFPSGEYTISEGCRDQRDYRVSFDRYTNTFAPGEHIALPEGIHEIARAFQSGSFPNPRLHTYFNNQRA